MELEVFKRYFDTIDTVGEVWFDDILISSNSYYVFFKNIGTNKVIALFSKKYFITVELVKDTEKNNIIQKLKKKLLKENKLFNKDIKNLEKISEIIEEFRKEKGLVVSQYEFWIPHCLVDGKEMETQFVASSYGVSKELAIDYLIQYDPVFKVMYDKETNKYMGLPLINDYEKANSFPLAENNVYIREYKRLNKFIENKERG